MISVSLIFKKEVGPSDGGSFEYNEKGSISIEKPKTYKEFEEQIRKKFKLGSMEIAIKALVDSEEINIRDEDSYADDDNENAREFKVYIEEDISVPSANLDKEINIDELLNIKDDLVIDENEFINMLDKQINGQEKIKMDEEEEEKPKNGMESLDSFLKNIDEEIKTTTENFKKKFIESIKKELSSFNEIIDNKVKIIKNDINEKIKATEDVSKDLDGMEDAMKRIDSTSNVNDKNRKEERKNDIRKEKVESPKKEPEKKEEKEPERVREKEPEKKEEKEPERMQEKEPEKKEEKKEEKKKEEKIEPKKEEIKEPKREEEKKEEIIEPRREEEKVEERVHNDGELTDEEVKKMYKGFEEDFGLDGILDDEQKEGLFQKIREFHGDHDKIKSYVEDELL